MRLGTAIGLCLVCACATSAPAEDQTAQASTTAFANDEPAYDFFIGKGLTNFQAAGIVGNLDQESGVDPASVQYGGGPGRGIAQWSVGGRWDTSTNDNVLHYASQHGESSGALNTQLEFIWYELTTFGYGFSQLQATTNVTDATVVFMSDYEICGTCAQSQRVAYAQDVLAAYGSNLYAGKYVSQSWPLASMPAFVVHCGESVAATLTLKNTGTKPWTSDTKLGTTMPRDRASIFAGADWLAPNRAATAGDVAPGANGTFTFAWDGPTGSACVPGMYDEHFGLVQEGVAWFSDMGQGGPPDNQIEALIDLEPGSGGSGDMPDAGVPSGGSGDPTGSGSMRAAGSGCNAGGGGGGATSLLVLVLCALRRRRRR